MSTDTFTQSWNASMEAVAPLSRKLGFRAYKHHAALSEETTAFSATLTLEGRKVATVRNDGHGGCTCVDWTDRGAAEKIIAEFNDLRPQDAMRVFMFEEYISDLADKHREDLAWLRFVKRWAGKGWTCFRATRDGKEVFIRRQDGRIPGDDSSYRRIVASGYTVLEVG